MDNTNLIKVIINEKDLAKYKLSYSASGRVIDELAFSAKQWTEEDLFENNMDYDRESFGYINEHFNFEDALLKVTKDWQKMLELRKVLECANLVSLALFDKYKQSGLQAGAFLALNCPDTFAVMLKSYEEKCKDYMHEYYDSEFLDKYAPEYKQELVDAVDDFWKQMNKEWLYGDYRDYSGVIYEIGKYWEAEDQKYDEDDDTFIFFFDKETAESELLDWSAERFSAKRYKNYLLSRIADRSYGHNSLAREKRQKYIDEAKKLHEYKEKQRAEAEEERKQKLLRLKK